MRRSTTIRLRVRAARRLAGAGIACAALAAAVSGCGGSASASNYTVRAIFQSAPFVISGLDVRVSGVKVGKVQSVDLTDDNQAAVTFTITDPGFKDFRKDAFCRVRPQALIGERYIECSLTETRPNGATAPARLPAIADGPYKGEYLLPVSNTAVSIDSDEVLNVNTATVREKFGIIIRELGTGLAGRGDELAVALRKGDTSLAYTNQVLKQLSEQREMLRQLTTTTDQTLQSLASERSALTGTITHGAAVTGTLARRQAELKASITQLNNLLGEVKPTADRATDLADQLTPIADDLNRSASDIATVLNNLPTAAKRGTAAVNSLGPTLQRGSDVLTSAPTNALIDRLVKTSAAVKVSGSVLGLTLGNFRSAGGLDYILNSIYGLAYSTNGRDANGNYLRGGAVNLLACALPTQVTATGCGIRLQNDTEPTGTSPEADAARATASSTATAARATSGSSAKTTTTPAKSTPSAKTTPSTSTPKTSPGTAPTTSSVDAKAASLLLGGSQ